MTNSTITPNPKTLTIYGTMLAGLFLLTACGGGALPTDLILDNKGNDVLTQSNSSWFANGDGTPLPVNSEVSSDTNNDAKDDDVEITVAPTSDSQEQTETQIVTRTEPQTAPQIQSGESGGASGESSDDGPSGAQGPSRVTAADSAVLGGLPLVRDVVDNDDVDIQNQFLRATKRSVVITSPTANEHGVFETRTEEHTGLDRTGVVRADPLKLDLSEATYDGVVIGVDAEDGVDFFTTRNTVIERYETEPEQSIGKTGKINLVGQVKSITETRYFYAGILSSTDLGGPVAFQGATAYWNGSFRTHNTNAVDFVLTVNFVESKISAFVKDSATLDNYYHITGNYANGFISGDVNWGTFNTDGAEPVATGVFSHEEQQDYPRENNGKLIGLIGAEGAVGAFLSGESVDRNGKVTGGTISGSDGVGYAGGFVAAPDLTGNPDVTLGDWKRAIPKDAANNGNKFVTNVADLMRVAEAKEASGASGSAGSTSFRATLYVDSRDFETKTRSGVAFFKEGNEYNAGLLGNTDLGAPLTSAPINALWKGTFQSVRRGDTDDEYLTLTETDFTLTVTFGDSSVDGAVGSVEAFVAHNLGTNQYLLIEGTYNNVGVITGTTKFGLFPNARDITPNLTPNGGTFDGVLTGLIGQEGAVGAFISKGNGRYAGGFVAVPFELDDALAVTAEDWARGFDTKPSTVLTAGTPQNEFLKSTGGILNVGDLRVQRFGEDTSITVTTLNLNSGRFRNNRLNADPDDGLAFFQGDNEHGTAAYAGIFDTTDLGEPLTSNTAKGVWDGQFQMVGVAAIDTDFTLEVTFGGAVGAAGSVEAFVRVNNSNVYYLVKGTYNNSGVITGTTSYGTFADGDRTSLNNNRQAGILAGLIGEEGAVGAVISTNAGQYAGGFVARPATYATYKTWLSSFNYSLASAGNIDGSRVNQFLQSGEDGINAGTIENASISVLKMAESDNGVSFLRGTKDENGFTRTIFAAGILAGTDVGRPMLYHSSASAMAEWKGKIQWVGTLNEAGVEIVGNGAAARDFTLEINFKDSLIAAFVKMDNANRHLLLNAGYNEKGQFTQGTVKYGVFAGNDRTATRSTPTGSDAQIDGRLTGIIGQEGAVGVFVSDDVPFSSIDRGFAGGFFAAPEPPAKITTNYASWLEDGNNAGLHDRPEGTAINLARSQLLRATNRLRLNKDVLGLTVNVDGGLSLNWATYDKVALDGDLDDAVAFFRGWSGGRNYYYAGLLSGTDLGAPLTDLAGASSTWHGQMHILKDGDGIATDIILTVNFTENGAGDIAGLYLKRSVGYLVEGEFSNKGIVTGIVQQTAGIVRTNTATLAGLIGEQGLVAAFAGDKFGGGLVARDRNDLPPPPPRVNYNTWVNGTFIDALGPADPCPEGEVSKFLLNVRADKRLRICGLGALNEEYDALPTEVYNGEDKLYQRDFVKTAESLLGDTKIVGGFSHNHVLWKSEGSRWNDYATTNRQKEVQEDNSYHTFQGSLHSDTDVGVQLPAGRFEGNVKAKWRGYLAAEGTSKWLDTWSVNTAITPEIDFTNRTITIPQQGGTGDGNERLTFNNMIFNESGFVTGYVDAPYNLSFGTAALRGVIGRNGMVAVFIQYFEKHHGYAGGLVACPTADPTNGTGACR